MNLHKHVCQNVIKLEAELQTQFMFFMNDEIVNRKVLYKKYCNLMAITSVCHFLIEYAP